MFFPALPFSQATSLVPHPPTQNPSRHRHVVLSFPVTQSLELLRSLTPGLSPTGCMECFLPSWETTAGTEVPTAPPPPLRGEGRSHRQRETDALVRIPRIRQEAAHMAQAEDSLALPHLLRPGPPTTSSPLEHPQIFPPVRREHTSHLKHPETWGTC